MDELVVRILFYFTIFFFFLLIGGVLFFYYHFRQPVEKNYHLFGFFMELTDHQLFAMSVCVVKYLFIIYFLFSSDTVTTLYLGILIFCSILFFLSTFHVKNSFIDFISSVSIYYGIMPSAAKPVLQVLRRCFI